MTAAIAERPGTPEMRQARPGWWQDSALTLAALPNAISCARLLVRSALTGWDLDLRCTNAIEAAMDELVVHAVVTTGVTDELPLCHSAFDHLTLIFVKLRLTPHAAQIEVWDSGDLSPAPQLSESAVIAACKQWGYDLPLPGKRVVWCVVPMFARTDGDDPTGLPGVNRIQCHNQ
jgi:anti-sigma regulatory factor (Ser/Thr protein kinase)